MKCLIVEDDPTLSAQLAQAMRDGGFACDLAADGTQGEFLGATESYDLAILDLGLPGLPGIEVLTRWREGGVTMPVLILTARDNWHEKVAGIDAGADDYLTKPFHMEELLARVRALLRRSTAHASAQWRCGPLLLDTRQARVSVDGRPLTLTSHEFKVLSVLMQRAGEVVSRSELTEHVYAQDLDRDSNTIEVFVGRLRKKLPPDTIETVRGLGYRLAAPQ